MKHKWEIANKWLGNKKKWDRLPWSANSKDRPSKSTSEPLKNDGVKEIELDEIFDYVNKDCPVTDNIPSGNWYIGNDGTILGTDQEGDQEVYIVSIRNSNKKGNFKKAVLSIDELKAIKQDKSELYSTSNYTQKTGLGFSDILRRAQWAYGEGSGYFPSYYAYAIRNLRNIKQDGVLKFESEKKMFNTMQDPCKLYNSTGDGDFTTESYKNFAPLKSDPIKLNNLVRASKVIYETLIAPLYPNQDPTGGASQWRGFKWPSDDDYLSVSYVVAAKNGMSTPNDYKFYRCAVSVLHRKGSSRGHVFFGYTLTEPTDKSVKLVER